ncbi:hypothetical protein ETI08_03445 [Macrococcoides goetzii]|nr:phage tail protein [Macrococcus goetzii]TDM48206.1 hypothetical protein ETI08_03445 [Macrococcus goetzii]
MLRIIDLNGKHYPVEGTTTLEEQLSSDEKLTVRIPYSENNSKFIDQVSSKWRIKGVKGHDDNTEYIVDIISRSTVGKKPKLELKCTLYGIELMRNKRYYDYHDTGYSLSGVMNAVFKDMPLTYRIVDDYDHNIEMESFGDGQSVLEIFSTAIELWEMEFVINGNVVEIYKHVVRRPNYILHDNINAKNVNLEEDGTNFYTYVRAYGDINDGEPLSTAGVSTSYTHPLANVAMIGKKEAPPIKLINNDNTSPYASVIREQLQQMAKDLVDNSLKITVTADFIALKDYPEAFPRIADEITFRATNINYEVVVRLIGITTDRTSKGEILKQTVTFGDQPIVKRHVSNINFAAQFISDLHNNKTKISNTMLDSAIQVATQMLLNARTELKFTEASGIWAVNKQNPQEVVVYNSAGLGISDDGGTTFRNAITGAGIVADAITSGTLDTRLLTISGTTGVFTISGDRLLAVDPNNSNKWVEIAPGQVTINGGGLTVNRPDGGVPTIINGMNSMSFSVWRYHPQFMGPEVLIDGAYFRTKSTNVQTFDAFSVVHNTRYLFIVLEVKMGGSDTVSGGVYVKGFGNTDIYQYQLFTGTNTRNATFKIDLGVPTGQRKYFYLQMKTGNDLNSVYAREISIGQGDMNVDDSI